MDTLAAPSIYFVAAAGTRDGVHALHAYGSASIGPRLVAYTPRGDTGHVLAFPVSRDDLTALPAKVLGWQDKVANPGISVECTPLAWIALCGILDAERELQMEALLARQPFDAAGVRLERVSLNVRNGWIEDDSRWLVAVARKMTPETACPEPTAIEKGLTELASLGLVQAGVDGWRIASSFADAAAHLQAHLSYGVVVVQTLINGQLERSLHIGWIRSLGSLWMAHYRDNGKGQLSVALRTLEGGTAAKVTAEVLAWAAARITAGTAPADKPAAATPVPPGTAKKGLVARFCSQCGTELPEGARFCGNCGAEV